MAGTIGGVPASNLAGNSAGSNESSLTRRIMLPPPRKGGIASSNSRRPYKMPTPEGPSILCPLKARKSTSSACTSVAMMRHALRRIDQHHGAHGMGLTRDLGHGIDRAQYVRDVAQGDQPRPLSQ